MAVQAVASYDADLPTYGLLKRDTRPPKTRLAEAHAMQTGIRTLVGFWEDLTSSQGLKTSDKSWKRAAGEHEHGCCRGVAKQDAHANRKGAPRELFRPYGVAGLSVACPPSYEECTQDVPPDYTVSVECCQASLDMVHVGKRTHQSSRQRQSLWKMSRDLY